MTKTTSTVKKSGRSSTEAPSKVARGAKGTTKTVTKTSGKTSVKTPAQQVERGARRATNTVADEPVGAASRLIDQRILEVGGWRGETLARMRQLIHEADPEIVEELKWRGTPVWSHAGIICTGETYAKVVKLTFARGASLPDPARLFNSSLEGNTRRAIDIHEGETVEPKAFKALVKAAIALNMAGSRGSGSKGRPMPGEASRAAKKTVAKLNRAKA
jgi:hypothetical protein